MILLEVWANLKDVVPEGNDYAVSDCGAVKNIKTNKILKNAVGSHGYHVVSLCSKESTKK
jgi:hypothetical protein